MMKHMLYDLLYYKMPYWGKVAVFSPISAGEKLQCLASDFILFFLWIHFYIYAQFHNLVL